MTLKGTAPERDLAKERKRQVTFQLSFSALRLDERAGFSPPEVSAVGTLVRLHRRDTDLPTPQALPFLCRDFHRLVKIFLAAKRVTLTLGARHLRSSLPDGGRSGSAWPLYVYGPRREGDLAACPIAGSRRGGAGDAGRLIAQSRLANEPFD